MRVQHLTHILILRSSGIGIIITRQILRWDRIRRHNKNIKSCKYYDRTCCIYCSCEDFIYGKVLNTGSLLPQYKSRSNFWYREFLPHSYFLQLIWCVIILIHLHDFFTVQRVTASKIQLVTLVLVFHDFLTYFLLSIFDSFVVFF